MKELWDKLKNNAEKLIALPWLANLMLAMADGHISEQEFHSLVKGATSFDMIILLAILLIMQFKK